MAYYKRVGTVTRDLSETEHTFHMYMFQTAEGAPGANEKAVVPPLATVLANPGISTFGHAGAVDWEIRDGPDPATSSIVARGRGSAMGDSMTTNGYYLSLDILFTDERFKGSTLKVLGTYDNVEGDGADHLAIVGGTGEFEYAQGTISYKAIKFSSTQIIREVRIRVFCRNVPVPSPLVNKEGPLGGPGGISFDIPAGKQPQRITSMTISVLIRSNDDGTLKSLAYSYIDQAGNEQTSGPWGGTDGTVQYTVNFPPSETLKKVLITTGVFDNINIVTSLTLVTSKGNTYGYGKITGSQITIPKNGTDEVVGFFGRSSKYIDALGVYTSPSAPTS